MHKAVALFLGACGTGKSTLSRALCRDDASEYTLSVECVDRKTGKRVTEKVKYCLSRTGHIAIAGNWKNGSDSICRMESLRKVVNTCLWISDVVIVDGFRCTCKFVDWLEELAVPHFGVIFVYFHLSLEANVVRLMRRRALKGAVESSLPDKTYNNLLGFRERAATVWQHARQNYFRHPRAFVTINDIMTPKHAADLVQRAVTELWEPATRL
jgi:adenylate kinase family enzyme